MFTGGESKGKDQEEIGEVVIEKRKKVSSVVQERSCETDRRRGEAAFFVTWL